MGRPDNAGLAIDVAVVGYRIGGCGSPLTGVRSDTIIAFVNEQSKRVRKWLVRIVSIVVIVWATAMLGIMLLFPVLIFGGAFGD